MQQSQVCQKKNIEGLDQQLEKQYYYQRLATIVYAINALRSRNSQHNLGKSHALRRKTTKTGHLSSLSEDSRSNSGKFYCLAAINGQDPQLPPVAQLLS